MENITKELKANTSYIKNLFSPTVDFTLREFKVSNVDGALLSMDGLVSKQHISISIMNPIMRAPVLESDGQQIMDFLGNEILGAVEQVKLEKLSQVVEKLMAGFAIIMIQGCEYALAFGTQGFEKRGPEEPDNETMQRGSKEGFIESYQTNIALIRRRMRTTDLKFEQLKIGSQSNTPIVLCYLETEASPKLITDIKNQIYKCDLKSLMAAGYLSGYLRKSKIFGNVGLTERPDTLCGKISEGRVAIIVDGTPTVIYVPNLFIENFQCLDDYANRPFYATFIRWLRYIAFFIAVFLPGMYIAVVLHRPELLPDILLIKIATEETKTPFTILWELLLVNLLYEIMREAGLRAPKALSQSVSIVGALVIGDAAVSAGLISAPSLMVIAAAAIAGYAIPKLYEQLSVLRLVLIIIGGVLGPWGIMLSGVFLVYNLCSEEDFGVPLTTPLTPLGIHSMRDVLVRASWKVLSQKTHDVQNMPGTDNSDEKNIKKL